ncbi:MAG TPA: hypothetical protein VMF08_22055 [Candidatus Sulfotelmatobacter sp.]|nr:hypothetical protein [Candidatus Sulfotelmatobacter sp.]
MKLKQAIAKFLLTYCSICVSERSKTSQGVTDFFGVKVLAVGKEAAASARNNATFHDNDNVAFVAFPVAEMLPTKSLTINNVADVADFQSIIKP